MCDAEEDASRVELHAGARPVVRGGKEGGERKEKQDESSDEFEGQGGDFPPKNLARFFFWREAVDACAQK